MKTRLKTSFSGCRLEAVGCRQRIVVPPVCSLQAPVSSLRSAFTLVELLVVVAIVVLAVGALLPALGSFFDSARAPNARNLISAHLAGARNYAVANNVTTALVFTEDTSGSNRQVRMYLARYDPTSTNFTVVAGRETTYLPDNILISNDGNRDNLEDTVVICFSAAGQLTVVSSPTISNPPIVTIGSANSRANFYLYDDIGSDPVESLRVNYYTGTVIE